MVTVLHSMERSRSRRVKPSEQVIPLPYIASDTDAEAFQVDLFCTGRDLALQIL